MSKPQGRISALALAAAVALGVASSDAQALALGRISVQSALGEPLRVDIDIPEINAEEASSLRVNVASPQAFRAAGLIRAWIEAGLIARIDRSAPLSG